CPDDTARNFRTRGQHAQPYLMIRPGRRDDDQFCRFPLQLNPVYERVRDSYDRVARRYAAEIGGELAGKPLDRALLGRLTELVADIAESSGSGVIGDLGCGPGHVAAYMSSLGASVLGVDLSPAMVDVGRAHYPDLQFRVGSLLALPIIDGELAGAVAF